MTEPINHQEALNLALQQRSESNLARCYLDLVKHEPDGVRPIFTAADTILAQGILAQRVATLEQQMRQAAAMLQQQAAQLMEWSGGK